MNRTSISKLLAGLCVFCFASGFLLSLWLQSVASLAPDPSKGNIYKIALHGYVYVPPEPAKIMYLLFTSCFALALAAYFARYGFSGKE